MPDHIPFVDNDVSQANRVTAEWLNDINDAAYGPYPTDTLGALLADTSSASNNAGLVGADVDLNYVAGTVGAAVFDQPVNVMWFLTEAERAQVKADGDTIDLTSKINAAKTWGGDRPLYLRGGTWSFTSLDLKGYYGGLIGDGIASTVLKVRGAIATAIDINETADVIYSPLVLKGFTLDCNSLANVGIDLRYRHHTRYEELLVKSALVTGIKEMDSWLNYRRDVRTDTCPTGWWLVGSNHCSVWVGGGASGSTSVHLKIESSGTGADGNMALSFTGFEVEFGGTGGKGIEIEATDVTFDTCYLGENIEGAIFDITSGLVSISGGQFFIGHTTNSYGITGSGGAVKLYGVKASWQTNTSISYLANSTGVKFKFVDCEGACATGGSPTVVGDVLDYGPPGIVFANRLGKAFTKVENNATATTALVSSNGRSVTCTAAPGPTPIVGLQSTLSGNAEWRDGEPLYLVLVYSSNKVLDIRLSGSSFGGAPTTVISTPASTSGAIHTHFKLDVNAAASAYTLLEVLINTAAVNDTFTLYDCYLADSRMLNKGGGQFGNLYKC